jgi:hypothetical protein
MELNNLPATLLTYGLERQPLIVHGLPICAHLQIQSNSLRLRCQDWPRIPRRNVDRFLDSVGWKNLEIEIKTLA